MSPLKSGSTDSRVEKAPSLAERIALLPDRQKALLRIELDKREGRPEPVAVIGLGCRFPGAVEDPAAYWNLLSEGRDALVDWPEERARLLAALPEDEETVRARLNRRGGFLGPGERVAHFDPALFRIAPREAARMDPQQRLLLETAWAALEDAGQDLRQLTGTDVGVFVGISAAEYGYLQLAGDAVHAHTHTGGALSVAANRLSYTFDFRGPSMAVDTACSSSLVAVNLALRSLRSGESSMAIAGGVNLLLTPEVMRGFEEMGVLSPNGRCAAFSDDADGIVRGEGAGLLVLKNLSAAIRDRDPVHALIRGGAVNQDGRSFGLTAPNQSSQEEVLRRAYLDAGVDPAKVDYVEAHGTGTRLGDPIEARALGTVLGSGRDPGRPCRLGSVKTNLGHLESAAGAAGLIKTVLMLKHRRFAPNLHFQRPNPLIAFDELGLKVVSESEEWTRGGEPRTAGVSSFGFGGTNAHIVLEEAPPLHEVRGEDSPALEKAPRIFVLSAADREGLRARIESIESGIADGVAAGGIGKGDHYDLCYTAALRRTPMDARLAVVSEDPADLASKLRSGLDDPALVSGVVQDLPVGPVFVFPGQGPVWWPLDPALLAVEPDFTRTIEECAEVFRELGDLDLMRELFQPRDASGLNEPRYLFPALFTLQTALVALWRARGIEPAAVIGHSTGEIASAHAAGILSLEDACKIIYHRGRLIGRVVGRGAMAIAELSHQAAEEHLAPYEGRLAVAAVNGISSVVISGDSDALGELGPRLEEAGVFFRQIEAIKVAGHSPVMDPILEPLRESLVDLKPRAAEAEFYSTVAGGRMDGGEETLRADHWIRNLRAPVLFLNALEGAIDAGHADFMEIGPHPVFSPDIQKSLDRRAVQGRVLRGMRRGEEARASLLDTTGRLFVAGYPVRLGQLFGEPGRTVDWPTYPFRREVYWFGAHGAEDRIPAPPSSDESPGQQGASRMLGRADLMAMTADERIKALEELVGLHAGRVLGVGAARLDPDRALRAFGMDSLMAVEIKNRVEDQVGLPLNAAEILKDGSVRSCAAIIADRLADGTTDGDVNGAQTTPAVTGDAAAAGEPASAQSTVIIPLTATQAWFFDHGIVSPHHWNLSVLLECPADTTSEMMREAVERVQNRHPAYRLRFEEPDEQTAGGQLFGRSSANSDAVFAGFDFSNLDESELKGRLEAECKVIQASLNIFRGPLFRVVHFNAGSWRPGRLLVVMHHLITDGFGFALFLGEVRDEFLALRSGATTAGRRIPLGYETYSRRLVELAATPGVRSQLAYWTSPAHKVELPPLPRDFPNGRLVDGSLVTVTDRLEKDYTRRFLHDPRRSKSLDAQLLLLGAVNRSFARWTGQDRLRIELETHGRDAYGIDATRLHGWCNVMFPLLLSGGRAESPRRTLELIDESLGAMPDAGSGFQLLRYLSPEAETRSKLARLPAPEVKVIYHGGVFEQIRSAAAPFGPASESAGPNYAEDNVPKYSIYVYGAVYGEELHVQLLYSENLFRRETMLHLLEGIKLELISILSD